ncbi:unnamed protein product, partial [Mesorhabditis belari]|uniref:glycogenin glucosyltransferase n=1 Tax=Mesorhabditis belari TaxID=2138241 RepID=A0AAF3J6I3_9BILA
MHFLFLPIFLAILQVDASEFAYASTLSSNDFLLAARVLAYRLNSFNDYPYIIVATEEITNRSLEYLKKMNVTIVVMPKIETPYKSTHIAAKYQYSKINLWSLTQYKRILHLDLDTLPMRPMGEIFKCGSFCVTNRHSDRFNTGVFVMEPNLTIYEDMLNKVNKLESYDGGDQGFLNSYFDQLKYAPMFDGTMNSFRFERPDGLRSLSWTYNYDVGMYYLNGGKMLLQPKIMHFTLGPTKPWLWWTYPAFDLNWEWLAVRISMETDFGATRKDLQLFLQTCILLILLNVAFQLFQWNFKGYFADKAFTRGEAYVMPSLTILFSIIASFELIPSQTHPPNAWLFFFTYLIIWMVFISTSYRRVRTGQVVLTCESTRFACITLCLACAFWRSAICFHNRCSFEEIDGHWESL